MIIPLDKLKQLYLQIVKHANESGQYGCTTFIFVSNETDSLCALRILTVRLLPQFLAKFNSLLRLDNSEARRGAVCFCARVLIAATEGGSQQAETVPKCKILPLLTCLFLSQFAV